jgi:MFS family permease
MLRLQRFSRSMTQQSPTGLASGSQRLHYAWVIVMVASLICMITSPVRFAISMLVPYLQSPQGFGWSYFAISIAFALQWLATALISPLVGWLGDRYGVRRTMLLGAYLFVMGMVLTGSMTRLWHFYLSFGILLAVPLTIYQVPLVAGVAVWFRTNLGVAMGILQATQGLGTVVAIPLVSVLFAHVGLAWTFWGPGLVGGPVGGAGGTGSTRTRVTVRVTGARTADLRALAGEVAGDVGSTVTAVVGARNVGSVFLRGDRGAPAVVAVTPPPGTTVRSVPHGCTVADRERRIYHCVPEGVDPFEPGSEMTWRFRLRIDREDERSGWVGVRASHEEPLLDDNLAPLTVTTASGAGGGAAMNAAGDAGLPVTGPPVAALTAVGLLLVAAGAAMCRVGRPAR